MQDRKLAIQAAGEIRHSNRVAAKAIINIIKESEHFENEVDGYYNDIWGAIYPGDPQGWEYPAQIVRHVRCVAEELAQAKIMQSEWQHFDNPHDWYLKTVGSVLLQIHTKGDDIWQVWAYAGFGGITDYECHGTLEYAMTEGIKIANRLNVAITALATQKDS